MINRIIDFCVPEQVHRDRAGRRRVHRGLVVDAEHAAGRDPGPERHPGHRLLALGPQPGPRRRPGHLPDRLGPGGRPAGSRPCAASPTSVTPTSTSSSRTAPTSTGHGRARRSTSSAVLPRLPAGRADRARAGCDPARLDLPVRAGRRDRHAQPGRAALLPGLVPQVLPASRCRGWPRWPRSAGSGSSTRSTSTRIGCRPTACPSTAWSRRCAAGNYESAGRLIEFGGTEYSVRGRGYVKSVAGPREDRRAVSDSRHPHPRSRTSGEVVLGPDIRSGVADLDGKGDVVSGIVVMRHGQNALDVIDRVKAKLREIEPGLPAGVKVVPVYDRSELIRRSIDNLNSTVIEVLITVSPGGPPVPLAHPERRHPGDHASRWRSCSPSSPSA